MIFKRGLDPKEALDIGVDSTQNRWNTLLPNLKVFYSNCGYANLFQNEQLYLYNAFQDIDKLWKSNLSQIDTIKYIMLSEAPLWGNQGLSNAQYVYNINNPKQSVFFSSNQLKKAIVLKGITPKTNLKSKNDLLMEMKELGYLIIDVSPFALNKVNTSINYSRLSGRVNNNYKNLIQPTLNTYFDYNLKQIKPKLPDDTDSVKVFYRYPRIEKHLGTDISKILGKYGLNVLSPPNNDIFYQGGGIDVNKLASIL